MMTTQALDTVMDMLTRSKEILSQLKDENHSLEAQHGYSLMLMIQELEKVIDNAPGYLTADANILEMIQDCGDTWQDQRHIIQEELI